MEGDELKAWHVKLNLIKLAREWPPPPHFLRFSHRPPTYYYNQLLLATICVVPSPLHGDDSRSHHMFRLQAIEFWTGDSRGSRSRKVLNEFGCCWGCCADCVLIKHKVVNEMRQSLLIGSKYKYKINCVSRWTTNNVKSASRLLATRTRMKHSYSNDITNESSKQGCWGLFSIILPSTSNLANIMFHCHCYSYRSLLVKRLGKRKTNLINRKNKISLLIGIFSEIMKSHSKNNYWKNIKGIIM